VVSMTYLRPYSRLSRSEPLLFLPSRFSVILTRLTDPVPDPILHRKSGRAGNRNRTSGSIARYSDNYTTQAVNCNVVTKIKLLLLT
jgi:hypothetical protein